MMPATVTTKSRWLHFANTRLPRPWRSNAKSAAEFLKERIPTQIILPSGSLAIGNPVLQLNQVLFTQSNSNNQERQNDGSTVEDNSNLTRSTNANILEDEEIPDFYHLIVSPQQSDEEVILAYRHRPHAFLVLLMVLDFFLIVYYTYSFLWARASDGVLMFFNVITLVAYGFAVPNLVRQAPNLGIYAIALLLSTFQAAYSLTLLYQMYHLIHGLLAAAIAIYGRIIRPKFMYTWFIPGKFI